MPDDVTERVKTIIERPIGELVELGLEGGAPAAIRMLAFQYIIRLQLADDRERLEQLRDEISDYLEAEDEPPARPVLTVVN